MGCGDGWRQWLVHSEDPCERAGNFASNHEQKRALIAVFIKKTMANQIFLHTDRPEYVGGDVIYGTVFLLISHPVPAKKLYLELKVSPWSNNNFLDKLAKQTNKQKNYNSIYLGSRTQRASAGVLGFSPNA